MSQNISSLEKTTVFNLIILDESGSMEHLTPQTLSGCNETINVIKSAAKENKDKLKSFVSIYAFQSGSNYDSRYLIKNANPENVRHITSNDYHPCGCTPLLDAVGSTLAELKAISETHENSTGIVTIITDGYENSSRNYTWQSVSRIISQLKEKGWTINLIGANIDVEKMGEQFNIDNRMSFKADKEDTKRMFGVLNKSVSYSMDQFADEDTSLSMEERISTRKKYSKGFFRR